MSKTYVGDTGTVVLLDTGTSLSAATAVTIEARKPNGALVSWTGTVSETTKIRFVSLLTTFDQPGAWILQAKAVMPTGTWLGESVSLQVHRAFA